MENNKKLIAAIFEEQKVFITFRGDCYRYEKLQAGFHCVKMDKLSQKIFWDNYRQNQVGRSDKMMNWHPVAYGATAVEKEPYDKSEEHFVQNSILNKLCGRVLGNI